MEKKSFKENFETKKMINRRKNYFQEIEETKLKLQKEEEELQFKNELEKEKSEENIKEIKQQLSKLKRIRYINLALKLFFSIILLFVIVFGARVVLNGTMNNTSNQVTYDLKWTNNDLDVYYTLNNTGGEDAAISKDTPFVVRAYIGGLSAFQSIVPMESESLSQFVWFCIVLLLAYVILKGLSFLIKSIFAEDLLFIVSLILAVCYVLSAFFIGPTKPITNEDIIRGIVTPIKDENNQTTYSYVIKNEKVPNTIDIDGLLSLELKNTATLVQNGVAEECGIYIEK